MEWAKKPYRSGAQLAFLAPAETFASWTGEASLKQAVRFTLYYWGKLVDKIPKYKIYGPKETPYIRVPRGDADAALGVLENLMKKAAPGLTATPAKFDKNLVVYEAGKKSFHVRRDEESASDLAFDKERAGEATFEIAGQPAVLFRLGEAKVGVDDDGCLFTSGELDTWPAKSERVLATLDVAGTIVASYIKSAAKQLKGVDGTDVAALDAFVAEEPIKIVATKNKSASSAGVRDGGVIVRLKSGRYEVRTGEAGMHSWLRLRRV